MEWFEKFIGKPYCFGGTEVSFDCLTLIITIVNERYGLHIKQPDNLKENWADFDRERYWKEALIHGDLIPNLDHIKEGDIVFFRFKGYPSHAGFMVDRHKFIHILDKDMVRLDYLGKHPWKTRFWGAVRVGKVRNQTS